MAVIAETLAAAGVGENTPPVLVLGLGNMLLADEGVGVEVIERLQRDYRLPRGVELLDGGTSGMTLLDDLRGREKLIVVDAVRTGQPPGTIVVLRDEAVPAFFRRKVSPHQLALSDVLAVLTLTGEKPPEVIVIGVEPLSLETRLGLTDLIEGCVDRMIGQVVGELRTSGCGIE